MELLEHNIHFTHFLDENGDKHDITMQHWEFDKIRHITDNVYYLWDNNDEHNGTLFIGTEKLNSQQVIPKPKKITKKEKNKMKYILDLNDFIEHKERTLYRIVALRDFNNVMKDEKGGYIESESNLSQEGNCWVYNNAQVYNNAKVYDDAVVCDRAKVYDDAQVYNNAQVYGSAKVYNNALVYGTANVYDKAQVYNNAQVYDYAHVYDYAQVYDYAHVYGSAYVYGASQINTKKSIKELIGLPKELNDIPDNITEVVIDGKRYVKKTMWNKD